MKKILGAVLLTLVILSPLACGKNLSPTTSAPATVTPTPTATVEPDHFAVACPPSSTAGNSLTNITVIALDGNGNVLTGFSDPIQFSSSDSFAALPAQSSLTNGVNTYSVVFKTSGNQTLTVADTLNLSIRGTSNAVTVLPAAATHLIVVAPSTAAQSTYFNFTVTAEDQYDNVATLYAGTVLFTSTSGGSIPPGGMLTNGTFTFTAGLSSLGNQTITGTDSVTSSLKGTSNSIDIVP